MMEQREARIGIRKLWFRVMPRGLRSEGLNVFNVGGRGPGNSLGATYGLFRARPRLRRPRMRRQTDEGGCYGCVACLPCGFLLLLPLVALLLVSVYSRYRRAKTPGLVREKG